MACLSFIELDKAVVHVIRLVSFCDCGFSLAALWCPSQCLLSYWCFSYVGRGVSLHGCSSKCSGCSLPWMWGVSSWLLPLTLDIGYRLLAAHHSLLMVSWGQRQDSNSRVQVLLLPLLISCETQLPESVSWSFHLAKGIITDLTNKGSYAF